jgi:ribonuclease-3 family protein
MSDTDTSSSNSSKETQNNLMTSTLFTFPPSKPYKQLSPLVLAYLGDAVYETYVRQYVISQPNHRPNHLHRESVRYVSNKAQSKVLELWMPQLTEEEVDIVKRGRNAKSGSVPKNADVLEYRHSTAFECLIGYLYYRGSYERLQELMDIAINSIASSSSKPSDENG